MSSLEHPSEVFVSNYGSFLGKKSERLVLKENGQTVLEVPFYELQNIIIETSGASISTDCIKECMQRGIPISFLSSTGKPYATIVSPHLTGTVVTRRAQYEAFKDKRGVQMVKLFVEGKLKNQVNTLKYFAKYRKSADKELFNNVQSVIDKIETTAQELKEITGNCINDVRGQIMSAEGRAGNLYWQGIKLLTAGKIDFPGREHAGAADPMNSLLNYGYGILYGKVEKCLILAGLDPYAGFLHVDRSGKESLVYDFVEEFRQPVVDRVVVAMINKGIPIEMEDGQLSQKTRRDLAERIKERLDTAERFQGKKYRLQTIIQMQARRIATHLRGEARYKPYVSGW
ncbi:CRISPR-associated endonuclease Cas1 [Desulfotomaculum nigrificans]|uniref:CRISPR-associated endonuclease Cas1 n=1 Tax=Desulfotomaculum nigrificans TaxID=1565 RepID=UPI001FA750D3|nr:CRISPR-associated endonuclease Cas1 [Desulfotomaculum nigrificans]